MRHAGPSINREKSIDMYHPKLGRFIQRDPIDDVTANSNLYRYVTNNPTTFSDPSGLIIIGIPGLGPDSTGYANDALRTFVESLDGRYVSRHFFGDTEQRIKEAAKKGDPVIIIGYSRGAVSAIQLAQRLEKENITVDLLVTLDPVLIFPGTETEILASVPKNVKRAVNYYETSGRRAIPGLLHGGEFRGNRISGPGEVENIERNNITHPNFPNNLGIQEEIRNLVKNASKKPAENTSKDSQ